MSRDYKANSNSPAAGKSSSPLLLGLFIGYALGLASAIGVWVYINQAPSPFLAKDKPADSAAAKHEKNGVQKGGQASGSEDKSDKNKTANGKPRFEFYKILPGAEETITEQQLKQAAQQPASAPPSKDRYFLQAGSFQHADDADNLKAKLALLGVEAFAQSVDLAEKGIWHRVRVGPYTRIDDINRVRATLQLNGVQTSLIKVREGA